MNENAAKLLFQINEKSKDTPIIYFARDAERALGLENLLENYYIVCIENSYIVEQFSRKYPGRILCTQKEGIELKNKSTLDLVNNGYVQEWVRKVSNGKFYALLFQFNNPTFLKVQNLGGTVLNNKSELNRKFEDKLSQLKFFNDSGIAIPKSEIINVNELNFAPDSQKLVVQLDRAHTGSGTFIIENETQLAEFKNSYSGNNVKVSEFIDGESYTVNGCITSKGVAVQGLQFQITGVPELTPGKGSTVGNDWSYANSLSEDLKGKIFEEVKKIGGAMSKSGYKGLFGVDLVINKSQIYIIEINARQSANIPLQTKLELKANQIPLLLLHLAEFLEIQHDSNPETKILPLEGSQIFLRSKIDNFKVKFQRYSGVYRLQSDNSAFNWSFDQIKMKFGEVKEKVIFIDEDKDKPLIWQNDGLSIDDIKSGFLLFIAPEGSTKDKFEELARMQFTNQIVYNNSISPWVLEALVNIENSLK